jgi:hypothetical protein
MKKYRALINGEGLFAMIEGQRRRVGFYTTRVVDADTPQQAEAMALASVKDEVVFRGLVEPDQRDLTRICVAEI